MVEQADLINGIERLIIAINGTCSFIQSIEEPPQDAEDVKNVLVAAKAKLSALETRIRTQHREDEFLTKWGDSAQKVLDYMRLTVGKVNAKLKVNNNGETVRMSYRRQAWPFNVDDTLVIQQQLNDFSTMLGIVNNSFLSDSVPEVLRASKQVDRLLKRTQVNPQPQHTKNSSRSGRLQPRASMAATTEDLTPVISNIQPKASPSLRRTLTRRKTIKAGATLNMGDLERLKVDVKGLQIGPLYPDACLVPKTRGTLAASEDLGRGILELFFSRSSGKVLAVYKNMHGNLQTIYWDVVNIKFNPVDQVIKSIFSRNPKHSKGQLAFRFYLRLYGTPRILKGPKDATALKNADTVTFFFEYRAKDNWKGEQINENEIRDQMEREWHYIQTNGGLRRDSLTQESI